MNKGMNYTVVGDLTDREARDLDEFLESSHNFTPTLFRLIEERSERVGQLYRGIKFRKRDLTAGYIYEHWENVSSWTIKEEVSHSFALVDYIPEGLIEEVLEEWGYDYTEHIDNEIWEKAYNEFVALVMIVEDGCGFVVNKHLLHNQFSKEEEVIVKGGKWQFTSFQEKKNDEGKTYYEVRLSEVTKAVA